MFIISKAVLQLCKSLRKKKKETNKNDNNNNNNGNNTDNNVTPAATAKLQLKAGKKTVKAGSTIALKKGKTVQRSLTINGVT